MIRTHNASEMLKVAVVLLSSQYSTCQIADEFGLYDSTVECIITTYNRIKKERESGEV